MKIKKSHQKLALLAAIGGVALYFFVLKPAKKAPTDAQVAAAAQEEKV